MITRFSARRGTKTRRPRRTLIQLSPTNFAGIQSKWGNISARVVRIKYNQHFLISCQRACRSNRHYPGKTGGISGLRQKSFVSNYGTEQKKRTIKSLKRREEEDRGAIPQPRPDCSGFSCLEGKVSERLARMTFNLRGQIHQFNK